MANVVVTAVLPQLTVAVVARVPVTATAAVTLPQLTSSIAAVPRNTMTMRAAYSVFTFGLRDYAITPTGGVGIRNSKGAYVFNDPSINVATGGVQIGGEAGTDFPLNELIVPFGGLLTGGVSADVEHYALNPVMAVTFPAMQLSFGRVLQGELAVTAPKIVVSFSGLLGQLGNVVVKAPRWRVELAGGVSQMAVSFAPMTVDMAGNQVYVGDLAVAVPVMTAALSGSPASSGALDVRMPVTEVAMSGDVGVGGDLALEFRATTVAMTGSPGVAAAGLAVTAPAMTVAMTGASRITGTLSVTAPAMTVDMLGTIRTQLMLILVTNTTTGAVSTYEDLSINSMCQLGNLVLFADATGVHVMDADTDNATAIDASVQTGIMDLGSGMQKRLTDVYMSMRSDGDLTLSIGVDEQPVYAYTMAPHGVSTLKQRRAPIGKGMRGKYWQLEIANTAGCDFDLDTIDISVADTDRRI